MENQQPWDVATGSLASEKYSPPCKPYYVVLLKNNRKNSLPLTLARIIFPVVFTLWFVAPRLWEMVTTQLISYLSSKLNSCTYLIRFHGKKKCTSLFFSLSCLIYSCILLEVTAITTVSIQNGFMWQHCMILDCFPSLLFVFLTAEHKTDISESWVYPTSMERQTSKLTKQYTSANCLWNLCSFQFCSKKFHPTSMYYIHHRVEPQQLLRSFVEFTTYFSLSMIS